MPPVTTDSLMDRIRETVRPEDGRIPMFIYSSPEVYGMELQRVFGKAWNYVAHTSEIPDPGSFVVRNMGEQSVIVGRGDDKVVRVFLNSCRHRGMKLACEDFGKVKNWRCPYHGFAYASDGEFMGTLVGAPFERVAYPGGLDKDALHLIEARCETYRGMVFATWDQEGESLEDSMGDLKWYMDIILGRAEMEVVGVPQRFVIPTGWKFPSENFTSDAYHTVTAHAFLSKLGLVKGLDFASAGFHVDPGGGHGLGIGVHDEDKSWFPAELQDEYAANLEPDQLALLGRVRNFHGNMFPNLSYLIPNFIDVDGKRVTGQMLRLWQPIGPDKVEVWSWHLVEKNAPDWWKRTGRRMYVQTFGTSGMFDQDDTEIWEQQTHNANSSLTTSEEVWMDFGMGIHHEPLTDFPGPGNVFDGKYNESAGRGYYVKWRELMLEGE